MSDVTNPLKAFRKRKKLPLQFFAEQLGVTVGQMSRIEREGTASLDHALKLQELTRLPVKTFARRAEDA